MSITIMTLFPHSPRRVDAGKVELDGASYLGQPLPFSISQLLWIEVILMGGVEILRNNELDLEKRIYPGVLRACMRVS